MRYLVLTLCLAAACLSIASAKTKQQQKVPRKPAVVYVPITLTPAQQAAKAVLDRMSNQLTSADGISFNETISYLHNGTLEQETADVTLEHPAKVAVKSTSAKQDADGTIIGDGSTCTMYNALSNEYVAIAITPDLFSLQQALDLGGKEIFPKDDTARRDLKAAIAFPMLYFDGVYTIKEVPAGDTLNYVMSNTLSITGQPEVSVTESLSSPKMGQEAATYVVDPTTNLPQQYTQTMTRAGMAPETIIQETFSNIKTLRGQAASDAYTFMPPAGAHAYTVN